MQPWYGGQGGNHYLQARLSAKINVLNNSPLCLVLMAQIRLGNALGGNVSYTDGLKTEHGTGYGIFCSGRRQL